MSLSAVAVASIDAAVASTTAPSGARDFDFLFGRWRVENRRLRERLADCTTWDEFDASAECRPVLGGQGNLETFETTWQGGFRGLALRLFDPVAQRWSIHWASDRGGVLEPAVSGIFEHGIGNFFGPQEHRGTRVLSRYRWSGMQDPAVRAERATWDQAWSTDDGRTWETNWVMQFTRID